MGVNKYNMLHHCEALRLLRNDILYLIMPTYL